MKLVNRKEFLAIDYEVIYSSYDPYVFEPIAIKVAQCGDNDWFLQNIVAPIDASGSDEEAKLLKDGAATGKSIPLDFESSGRDGCFDPDDTQYAVWEREDVLKLIARLQRVVDQMPSDNIPVSNIGVYSIEAEKRLSKDLEALDNYIGTPEYLALPHPEQVLLVEQRIKTRSLRDTLRIRLGIITEIPQ